MITIKAIVILQSIVILFFFSAFDQIPVGNVPFSI